MVAIVSVFIMAVFFVCVLVFFMIVLGPNEDQNQLKPGKTPHKLLIEEKYWGICSNMDQ